MQRDGLTWNYRMFHRSVPDGIGGVEDEWTIREAYYKAGSSEVSSWTAEPCHSYGETKLALMEDVSLMTVALSQPVVEITPDGEHLASESTKKASLR